MLDFDHLQEGTRFRLARVAAGLTLFDVGRAANVSPPRLSEFERGRGGLSADSIDRVRAVLAVAGRSGSQGATKHVSAT